MRDIILKLNQLAEETSLDDLKDMPAADEPEIAKAIEEKEEEEQGAEQPDEDLVFKEMMATGKKHGVKGKRVGNIRSKSSSKWKGLDESAINLVAEAYESGVKAGFAVYRQRSQLDESISSIINKLEVSESFADKDVNYLSREMLAQGMSHGKQGQGRDYHESVNEERQTNMLGLLGSKGIGSLPQVEKIIDIRAQSDGMAALVRTIDGNAYEVVVRQADDTTHPELQRFTEETPVDEGTFGKAAGALAIAAALWGGAELSSAKHTPLGQALQQAAQQGDTQAAQHLKKLDVYLDANDVKTIQQLNQQYLNKD